MARYFQPARSAKTVPTVQSIVYTPGQTYTKGALVVLDVNGTLVECGANPASILGVALEAVDTKIGFGVPNAAQTTVFTGRVAGTSIAVADRTTEFSGRGVNGGTDPVVPLQAHLGVKYGVIKVGSDWTVNFADTVNTRVIITGIRTDDNAFLFKFLEANLARP